MPERYAPSSQSPPGAGRGGGEEVTLDERAARIAALVISQGGSAWYVADTPHRQDKVIASVSGLVLVELKALLSEYRIKFDEL